MKRVSIYIKLVLILIGFIVVTTFAHGLGKTDLADKVISVTSFVFGVILAFSIANRHSRLSTIREKLREQDAKLLEIYYISSVFDVQLQKKIKEHIDGMLISQLDYMLIDFEKEAPKKVEEFFMFMEKIKVDKRKESQREKILEILEGLIENYKAVYYQVNNKMLFYEWISLLTMAGILFFTLIVYFNTNEVSSIVIVSFLCTAISLLLIVLKDLDSLEWQEQNWIWQPLTSLFIELDLLPYFPEAVFKMGRIRTNDVRRWDGVKKIRIAHYPHPYPDMLGKEVEIVNLE